MNREHAFRYLIRQSGFTLIELVIVIIMLGALTSIAVRQFGESTETAKMEHSRREMNALVKAIAGDPATYNHGSQADFGYVGDNGALPTSLDHLLSNPGGWSTWDGPYVETGFSTTDFKTDGWGTSYSIVSAALRSTGSGTTYDVPIANAVSALTSNTVSGTVVDASQSAPGSVYKDSIRVLVSYPNGSGATTTGTATPTARGEFTLSGIPVGNRTLRIIYLPSTDTISYAIVVLPGKGARIDAIFPHDLF